MLGKDSFLKDGEGNFVKSHLNARLLEEIAVKTGGAYVQSAGAVLGLDLIYERDLAKLEKRDITAQKARQYNERFQIPLGMAFFFLCLATFLPERKKDGQTF
jgi:Ca-activated chloride channel homolog